MMYYKRTTSPEGEHDTYVHPGTTHNVMHIRSVPVSDMESAFTTTVMLPIVVADWDMITVSNVDSFCAEMEKRGYTKFYL